MKPIKAANKQQPKVSIEELTFKDVFDKNPHIKKLPLEKQLKHLRAHLEPSYKWTLTNIGAIESLRQNKPTKLLFLLARYYEKGKQGLTKTEVLTIARENNMSEKAMLNKWREIEDNQYYFHENNLNSAKEFLLIYKRLMNYLQNNNKALKAVENDYKLLIETYPTIPE